MLQLMFTRLSKDLLETHVEPVTGGNTIPSKVV
jgi:hypothetical protein